MNLSKCCNAEIFERSVIGNSHEKYCSNCGEFSYLTTPPTTTVEGIDFSIHLQSVTDPLEMLDLFIKKWLPNHYGHLSDTDDNDGEYLRQAITRLIQEAYNKGRDNMAFEAIKSIERRQAELQAQLKGGHDGTE